MKVTFDLPERLYREVKARTAREGCTVREVVLGLFAQWLEDPPSVGASIPRVDWHSQRPPLGHLLSTQATDHSLESIRASIVARWDEPG